MLRFVTVALALVSGCATVENANNGGGQDLATGGGGDLDFAVPSPDLARAGDGGVVAAVCAGGGHIVINEFRTGTAATGNDEFIELASTCTNDFDLTGWNLVYRSAAGTANVAVVTFAKPITANGFFLVGGPAYTGTATPDQTYTGSGRMASAGGGLALLDSNSAIVDSVGYGSATNAFIEGAVATKPPDDQSLARIPSGVDTNHNNLDFAVATTPTPRAAN
jgi:hypothetical protein